MNSKQDTREMLVSGNVFSTMLKLSVPAILGMVVIGLYNFMDAVFVGQGSASVLSRAIDKKDQETVDKILGNLIAVVSLFSIIFARQLLTLAGAEGEVFGEANGILGAWLSLQAFSFIPLWGISQGIPIMCFHSKILSMFITDSAIVEMGAPILSTFRKIKKERAA